MLFLGQREALLLWEGVEVKALEDVATVTFLDAKRAAIPELETPEDVVGLWSPCDHCLVTEVTPKTRQSILGSVCPTKYVQSSYGLRKS